MEKSKLIISPKTKVLQLIEEYPQLEDVLISYVPIFSKLKNPILRKTVAKIATLQQAANIGNVDVSELINVLRKETGQELLDKSSYNPYNTSMPAWHDETRVRKILDVREMLDKGEHPVNMVMEDLKQIEDDTIYKLIAPFLPAPLIDKAISMEFKHWISKESDELYLIYFKK